MLISKRCSQHSNAKNRLMRVDRTYSGGLSVSEYWCLLFNSNEEWWEAKKYNDIFVDRELVDAMIEAFPGREDSYQYWASTACIRVKYNQGRLSHNTKPAKRSAQYERDKNGHVTRIVTMQYQRWDTTGAPPC